jgi:tetratricopeptide (TPR) repeat protein
MEMTLKRKSVSAADIVQKLKQKRNHLSRPMADAQRMEITPQTKTAGAREIMNKITEGEKHLRQGNLFSSIVTLREVLNLYTKTKDIQPKDKATLAGIINDVQRKLADSREFIDLYGKVIFRDDDFTTSYDFLCQLIMIKEEEIASVLVNDDAYQFLKLEHLSKKDREITELMVSLVERGELSMLQELVAANDALSSLVLAFYNEAGISYRKTGNIDKAIIEYKKALSIAPNDEHLHYNMARAFMEIGQKRDAEACIDQAVQLNPQFHEGLKMQKYIEECS